LLEDSMIRAAYDHSLQDLQARVLALGSEVEQNIPKVVTALLARDIDTAYAIIESDKAVNERQITIIMDCLKLIATQQPTARDMRFIAATLEIVGELERINDYVKGISRTSLLLGDQSLLISFRDNLPIMAGLARNMLRRSLDAFAKNDETLARSVPPSDDLVDDIFRKLYVDILAYARDNPQEIERASQLEWVIHNIERAADRMINICEWVIYMATGIYQEIESEYEAPPLGTA
ncbi:MAG: phosphate signaling complex protein PhoU, partial [Anaerolineales bacterium]|nr:phosphate signaling complex protein PhoU [Anaerolineales bacterium]